MKELNNETYDLNNINPEEYIKKINELNGSINAILDEFKKIYVIVKMNPGNEEYQRQLENITSSLTQIQSKLFSISNDIQVNIDDLNKKLLEIDILIRNERNKNAQLKKQLSIIEDKNKSSYEMINNYTEIYNIKYLRNWSLFLSTIICIMTISTVYKSK